MFFFKSPEPCIRIRRCLDTYGYYYLRFIIPGPEGFRAKKLERNRGTVWGEEEKGTIALVQQHAGHWMGANRPSLQQRDGRLDPKGLIYNPKLPILCDVCCYYFAVFPKRKLEYHPFSTLSSLESTPHFLFYQNTRARLDSNEYYFLYTHPYVPVPSWLRNGGVIRGNIYTPFTSSCKWQLKWITPLYPRAV